MGFLSKLKNKVTGGWADVTIDAPAARVGTTTTLTASVVVKGEPIQIDDVRIQVRHRLENPTIDHNLTDGIKPPPSYTYNTFMDEVVAGAQTLEAGSVHTFTATYQVSAKLVSGPTSTYQARAIVNMAGNDPDSGWIAFPVSG